MIDMVTYLSVFSTLALALSVTYFVSWLMDKRSESLLYWAAGLLLIAVSSSIMLARLYLRSEISMVLGNSLSVVSYVLILCGVREFFGRTVPSVINCSVIFLASFFVLAVAVEIDYQTFNIVVVAAIMFLYGLIAYNLLRDSSQRSLPVIMTGLACILTVFFLVFRLLDHILIKEIADIQTNSAATQVALILSFASFVVVYTGFLAIHLERAHKKLITQDNTDRLTQLRTREDFITTVKPAYARSTRTGEPATVLMIDVDSFKPLNDSNGHLAGDYLLKTIADSIKHELREQDIVARYGGKEFIAFLPNTEKLIAVQTAERLREKIESMQLEFNGEALAATISIGVAEKTDDGDSIESIISNADEALGRAKAAGCNCVIVT